MSEPIQITQPALSDPTSSNGQTSIKMAQPYQMNQLVLMAQSYQMTQQVQITQPV